MGSPWQRRRRKANFTFDRLGKIKTGCQCHFVRRQRSKLEWCPWCKINEPERSCLTKNKMADGREKLLMFGLLRLRKTLPPELGSEMIASGFC
ncbi:hypothetical protein RRG08_035983 [Elysia crispata]|uniref:Uncharacterized protein n=1 Tax=Elysia crispata TaxID=231223 RepID=A0AAE1AQX6_9GAST|nr:hypothetical protein RRG08_035983 [Elysia crispata]